MPSGPTDNYEDWSARETERIGGGMPTWIVIRLDEEDSLVTCPRVAGRCGHGAIVNHKAWMAGEHISGKKLTRSCTYCFKTSRVPPPEIIDANTGDPINR